MMRKKFAFSIITGVLFIFCFNFNLFAQETKVFAPFSFENSTDSSYPLNFGPANSGYWLLSSDYNPAESKTVDSYEDSFDFDDVFSEYTEQKNTVSDPLYYFNYLMYSFNDVVYFALLQPLATGYKIIVPTPVRSGIGNFFYNLAFPVRFVNNLLQGKIKNAGKELQIFLVNSSIGILGFVQVAQENFGLNTHDEDFGQTLGNYSIGNGFYLVLPILGPSTLRDLFGRIGDYFLMPVNYVEPWELALSVKTVDMLNTASFRLGDYEMLKKASLDPYVALRDAYITSREKKVKE